MIINLRWKNTIFHHFHVIDITGMEGKKFFLKRLIVNRLKSLETKVSETIFVELTVSRKKWLMLFVYRPPKIATM